VKLVAILAIIIPFSATNTNWGTHPGLPESFVVGARLVAGCASENVVLTLLANTAIHGSRVLAKGFLAVITIVGTPDAQGEIVPDNVENHGW